MTRGVARQKDGVCYLRLLGHATGSEAVCAGISTLVATLSGWMDNHRGNVHKITARDIAPGNVVFQFSGDETAVEGFSVVVFGLYQLANSYPQYFSMDC